MSNSPCIELGSGAGECWTDLLASPRYCVKHELWTVRRGSQYIEEKLSVWMERMRSGWGWILPWFKLSESVTHLAQAGSRASGQRTCHWGQPSGEWVLRPPWWFRAGLGPGCETQWICCFIGRAQWLTVREMWSASQFESTQSRAKKRII